jgi:DNA-binding IscR family transcriptional regulator
MLPALPSKLERRSQRMPPAENIRRQIAVAVVIALEEAALLVSVQGIVGGVEIKNDLLACAL